MQQSPILVVGASGKTGRRVMQRLTDAAIPVRSASRSTTPAFDWKKPSGWSQVLEGIKAAYLTYHPDLSEPQAEGAITEFCRQAKVAGVEHIVLLSGRGEEGATKAENVLRNSGIHWNVIQASWFAQNFSEDFMLEGIQNRELVLPMCLMREPFVDADDIADVAMATLMEPGLQNRLFEVTGPRLMTFSDCLTDISQALGQEIALIELPLKDYIESLREHQVPEYLCDLLFELFTQLFDGRNAYVADGVQQALGRPATDFRLYANKVIQSNQWDSHKQPVATKGAA